MCSHPLRLEIIQITNCHLGYGAISHDHIMTHDLFHHCKADCKPVVSSVRCSEAAHTSPHNAFSNSVLHNDEIQQFSHVRRLAIACVPLLRSESVSQGKFFCGEGRSLSMPCASEKMVTLIMSTEQEQRREVGSYRLEDSMKCLEHAHRRDVRA